MTWKDIKVATLQKMFAADGNDIPDDGSADEYLAGMPYVANEALNMLSTAGKYLVKELDIEHDAEHNKFDMKDLVNDFYSISKVFFGTDYEEYKGYRVENGVLLLYGAKAGDYVVHYNAYPVQINDETPDSYELPLAKEVAVLLPLYMASELYKDDDNSIATTYRNEFEIAFDRLSNISESTDSFVSESGWI